MSDLGIFGRGRLATEIARAAAPDFDVAWMLGRDDEPTSEVEVAIDASHADAVPAHVEWAIASATPIAVGATGWEIADLEQRVGDRTGVLVAPNFALTVALVRRLAAVLGGYAAADETRDPYLLEHHHSGKADAPSGTAKLLAEAVLDACPRKREWTILDGPVEPDQLGIGVLRAGSAPGTHVVGIDAPDEILEIRHVARSRSLFANGAVVAARWIASRRGLYSFDDLAAEALDPLFRAQVREDEG